MKVLPWFIFSAVSFTAWGDAASASPETVSSTAAATLGPAVEAAWSRAVQAREADGHLRQARAERAAADSLWSAQPSFGASYDGGGDGDRESEIGISLPLWRPGQKSAERASARSEVEFGEAYQHAAKLRVAGEVREAAWAIAAAEAEHAAVEVQLRTLERLADDLDRRVKTGDSARVDALAARAEWLAAKTIRADAQRRLDTARSRWTVLTGVPAPAHWTEATHPAPDDTLSEHPELELARLNTERARKRVEAVRRSRGSTPEVSVRYRDGSSDDVTGTTRSVGVGIRIPFGASARALPQEAAALTEFDVAQAQEARLRETLAAEQETARAQVHTAEEQLRLAEERATLLRERAGLLEKSFRLGNTSLPDLLRVLESVAQAENSLARQRAALGLARSRLLQSSGILP